MTSVAALIFLFETKYAMAKAIQNLIWPKIISWDVITYMYMRRDIIALSRDLMTSSCRRWPLEVIFITPVSSRQSTKSRNKKQQIDREIKTRLICYAHKVQPVLSQDADGFMARNLHLSGALRDLWYSTLDDSLAKMKAFREIVYVLL